MKNNPINMFVIGIKNIIRIMQQVTTFNLDDKTVATTLRSRYIMPGKFSRGKRMLNVAKNSKPRISL